jgi:VanZ family protein
MASILNDRRFKWGLAVLWAGLIYLGSSLPGISVSDNLATDFAAHKFVHLFEYFVFYVLLYRATGSFWQSILTLVAFAIGDETHQSYTPGREAKFTDVLIDMASGLAGAFVCKFIWRYIQPILPQKLKS